MPISNTPSFGGASYSVWLVGPNDVEFEVKVVSMIHTEANADAAIQSLVNHLAEWPDLINFGVAQKTRTEARAITPDEPTP